MPLHAPQNGERPAEVALRSTDARVQPRNRLGIVVENLGRGVNHAAGGCPVSYKIGRENFDAGAGALANGEDGYQVHLGGGLGLDAGFGRKLRGLKVTSSDLGEYVERVVRRFVEQRTEGERFAQWVLRADEADLK